MLLFLFNFSAVPKIINYQGKLTDTDGVGRNGEYPIIFRILTNDNPETDSEGDTLFTENLMVEIENGLFDILLGETSPLLLEFDEPYFLEITVDEEILLPRHSLATVGYSFRSIFSDTAEYAHALSSSGGLGSLNVYKNDGTTNLGPYLGCMLGSADCQYHCGWSFAQSTGGVRRISDNDRRNAYGHTTLYYSSQNCTGTIYLGPGRRSGGRSDCYTTYFGTDSINYVYHTWCCSNYDYQSYRSYGGDCVNSSGSISAYSASKFCNEPECDFICGDGPCIIKP